MKRIFLAMALMLALLPLAAQRTNYKLRVLVAYYSHGDDRVDELARRVAMLTGGDAVQLLPEQAYPEDLAEYKATVDRQLRSGELVKLQDVKVDKYDVVFIGSPVFMEHTSPVANSFAADPRLKGRMVYPFVAFDINEHLNPEKEAERMVQAAQGSIIRRPLAVPGDKVARSGYEIIDWLREGQVVRSYEQWTDRMIFRAIIDLKERYPKATLADVYKSFYQNRFGPGHIIESQAKAKSYLKKEMKQTDRFSVGLESTGAEGRYVRVDVNYLRTGKLKLKDFLAALMASVEPAPDQNALDQWVKEWNYVLSVIDDAGIHFDGFNEDRDMIKQRMNEGKYDMHHSPIFNEAYQPHYRIISREQFDSVIRPVVDPQRRFK